MKPRVNARDSLDVSTYYNGLFCFHQTYQTFAFSDNLV
jgi:hypothetical protein